MAAAPPPADPPPTTAPATAALVEAAFDAKKHAELAEAIEQLSPDEAAFFLHKLEMALKKRKLQLVGYLAAMLVWLIGMVVALAYYGSVERGTFVGWVFLVPFAVVGAVLWAFGKWADRLGARPPPAVPSRS
jgi:hypothetical protein